MYKCKSCGASLVFDPKSQMLFCMYCRNSYEPESVDNLRLAKGKNEDTEKIEDKDSNTYSAISYKCTQCGAELLTTDETITTFCSYCGSFATLESKVTEEEKPDYIIPFKITKNECKDAYDKYIKKAFFAPKDMIDTQDVDKIRGIYMPYYVYTFEKHNEQINMGQKYNHRSGDYVYYDDYRITTKINSEYTGISHDASSNFYDSLSEAIAPFNYKEKKDFIPAYLCGFYADSADVDVDKKYRTDANQIINKELGNNLKKDKIIRKYNCKNPSLDMQLVSKKKALFPVYFMSTKNKAGDRISYAIMNGQTGEISAEIPIDFKKYLITSLLLTIPIFLLLNLFFSLTPTKLVICSIIFNIVNFILITKQSKEIFNRENRLDDYGFINGKNADEADIDQSVNEENNVRLKPIMGILFSIMALLWHPAFDLVYYAIAVLGIGLAVWSIFEIVSKSNLLTTRKLPQLEKRGGDENA